MLGHDSGWVCIESLVAADDVKWLGYGSVELCQRLHTTSFHSFLPSCVDESTVTCDLAGREWCLWRTPDPLRSRSCSLPRAREPGLTPAAYKKMLEKQRAYIAVCWVGHRRNLRSGGIGDIQTGLTGHGATPLSTRALGMLFGASVFYFRTVRHTQSGVIPTERDYPPQRCSVGHPWYFAAVVFHMVAPRLDHLHELGEGPEGSVRDALVDDRPESFSGL